MTRVAILGGGPAGVAAAWQLHRQRKAQAIVIEQRDDVGGNAGSFDLDGIPVDYGSHRLHPSCEAQILGDIRSLLGGDLLDRPRHGRIRLRGRWIHFPLQPLDLLRHLPRSLGMRIAADTVRMLATPAPRAAEASFASALEHALGPAICRDFYFPYAAKIWGLPPEELSVTQVRRRVSAASALQILRRMLRIAPGLGVPASGRFFYPRHGYGQISRALAAAARVAGAHIHLRTTVKRLQLGAPHRLEVEHDGLRHVLEAEHIWSTIPITALTQAIAPAAPAEVLRACAHIGYRAMVLVYLVVAQSQFTAYDAHYFPQGDIPLARLSEPKNYGARIDPAGRTVLCAELPCAAGDRIWEASDEHLAGLVRDSLGSSDLPIRPPVLKVVTKRVVAAYPIYRRGYEDHFARLDDWVAGLERTLTFGRQGLFAHDNTHHTLAMAYGAVDCLSASGVFDWARWHQYRAAFATHVVED
jgi:protoporphyrinogen oxidase